MHFRMDQHLDFLFLHGFSLGKWHLKVPVPPSVYFHNLTG
jgi:hypothetical protein